MTKVSNLMSVVFFVSLVSIATPLVFAEGGNTLTMATTTSTDNTGLLDYLAPKYKQATGVELKWTAMGTGKALKLGENCDVDILLVHSPAAEKGFVGKGFGTDRREIMYNDFVIIGPERDPARIQGKPIKEALQTVKSFRATFISRGDRSGTHQKELSLWASAGLPAPDKEEWYVQTGQGMLATIHIAAERDGYTMTDRGTYIKYDHNLGGNAPLKILVQGDAVLLNQYSVIAVNPTRCPSVRYKEAMQFIKWITSPGVQKEIGRFTLLEKPLFTPNALQ
jgi:tungstate transport system substrate-binding protein